MKAYRELMQCQSHVVREHVHIWTIAALCDKLLRIADKKGAEDVVCLIHHSSPMEEHAYWRSTLIG